MEIKNILNGIKFPVVFLFILAIFSFVQFPFSLFGFSYQMHLLSIVFHPMVATIILVAMLAVVYSGYSLKNSNLLSSGIAGALTIAIPVFTIIAFLALIKVLSPSLPTVHGAELSLIKKLHIVWVLSGYALIDMAAGSILGIIGHLIHKKMQ